MLPVSSEDSTVQAKANAIRERLFLTTKAFIEGTGREFKVTSGYRPPTKTGTPNHAKGAFDFRSRFGMTSEERHIEAKELSKALHESGLTNTVVIVEEAMLPSGNTNGYHLLISGPTLALTHYVNGQSILVEFKPQKFGDNITHTHVGIRPSATVEETFRNWDLREVTGSDERFQNLNIGLNFHSLAGQIRRTLRLPETLWNEQQLAVILIRAIAYGSNLTYSIQNGTYSGPLYPMGGGGPLNGGGGNGGGPGGAGGSGTGMGGGGGGMGGGSGPGGGGGGMGSGSGPGMGGGGGIGGGGGTLPGGAAGPGINFPTFCVTC